MYAKELKAGDKIKVGPNWYIIELVDNDGYPGRTFVEFTNGLTLNLKHDNVIKDNAVVVLGPKEVSMELQGKLQARLTDAQKRFGGTVWSGGDPLDALEEELLDAFVYLYVARRLR